MKNNTPTLSNQEQRIEDARLARERAKELEGKQKPSSLPLFRESAPPEPYPFSALGTILGPVAKRVYEVTKAADSICGHSALSAGALLTQPYADIHIDGRIHPLSIFSLTASESGGRKSAADKVMLHPIREYEKMVVETHREEWRKYKNKMDIWKKQREALLRQVKGDPSDTGLNLPQEPLRPLDPFMILDEPSYEGLVKLFAIGQPSMGLFSDEGGRMLGGFSMGKDQQQKTACGLSSLWDGKPISRIRGGDENLLMYGRRLSMHLMVQENILDDFLKNELLMGQGFISRCLIVAPPILEDRPYQEIDISQEEVVKKYYFLAAEILDHPFPIRTPDIPNELSPRPLSLSQEAKRDWIIFHDELQVQQKKDGIYWGIRRTANKAAEQALRIAGVLRLIDDIHAFQVTLEAMERAIVLTKYYLNELVRIMDSEIPDPMQQLAQDTLNWMKKRVKKEGNLKKVFLLHEVYQNGPKKIRNVKMTEKILGILMDHELIEGNFSSKEWVLSE